MYEENRFKLGMFVISGTALLVAFIFFLGLRSALEPKLRFYTVFDESVQGLEVGSPVKFKGVTIGSVADIKILRESKKIRVDMDVNPNSIDYQPEGKDNDSAVDPLTLEIDKGLCCQLQMTGITGMKFVEIDFFEDPETCIWTGEEEPGFIPPGVSVFQDTVDSMNEAISRIAKVDFEGIGNDMRKALQSVNKVVDSPEVHELVKATVKAVNELNGVVAKLNKSLADGQAEKVVDKLEDTLVSFEKMANSVKKQVDVAELGKLSADLRVFMKGIEGDGEDAKDTIERSLKKLNMALDQLTELVMMLEKDPASILRGKQQVDRFAQ